MSNLICGNCGSIGTDKKSYSKFAAFLTVMFGLTVLTIIFGTQKDSSGQSIFITLTILCGIWWYNSTGRICSACGSKYLINTDTPKGKELMARYNHKS